MSEINEFEGWRVPPEFVSDGCTWAPDKLLRVDLKPACVWHDWARRQLVPFTDMTIEEADAPLLQVSYQARTVAARRQSVLEYGEVRQTLLQKPNATAKRSTPVLCT